MFTLPEVRGQGVATALMRESIKQAMQDATDSGTKYMSPDEDAKALVQK
jgi:GNAT superfamily N-acetyltransferase